MDGRRHRARCVHRLTDAFPSTGARCARNGIDADRSLREFISRLTGKSGQELERLLNEGTAEGTEIERNESGKKQPHEFSRVGIRAAKQDGHLTADQAAALSLAADGLTLAEMAAALAARPDTVNEWLAVGRRVLGARNTAHAVRLAIRAGVIAA